MLCKLLLNHFHIGNIYEDWLIDLMICFLCVYICISMYAPVLHELCGYVCARAYIEYLVSVCWSFTWPFVLVVRRFFSQIMTIFLISSGYFAFNYLSYWLTHISMANCVKETINNCIVFTANTQHICLLCNALCECIFPCAVIAEIDAWHNEYSCTGARVRAQIIFK